MLKFCVRWLERMTILGAALAMMQFPAYLQNYLAHLTGHLAELTSQVDRYSHAASTVQKSVNEWIAKFSSSPDPDVAMQGELLSHMVERKEALEHAESLLQNASLWAKPFNFMRGLDLEIAREASEDFQLSLPLNLEGLCYALLGALVGWLLFRAVTLPFRLSAKKKRVEEGKREGAGLIGEEKR